MIFGKDICSQCGGIVIIESDIDGNYREVCLSCGWYVKSLSGYLGKEELEEEQKNYKINEELKRG
jgi:glycine cleavage system aminomethyltransferase T